MLLSCLLLRLVQGVDYNHYIKNMVCPRCIKTVRQLLDKLSLACRDVILGKVVLEAPLKVQETDALRAALLDEGYKQTLFPDEFNVRGKRCNTPANRICKGTAQNPDHLRSLTR